MPLNNAQYTLSAQRLLVQISTLFSTQKIPFLVIKGISLSELVYQDTPRPSSLDIDILIDPHDLFRAHTCIQTLGFSVCGMGPDTLGKRADQVHAFTYTSTDWPLSIDLHLRLSPGCSFPVHAHSEELLSFTLGTHRFFTLPPDIYLLYLCLHGSLHNWKKRKWVEDVALTYTTLKPHMDQVLALSKRLGLNRALKEGFTQAGLNLPASFRLSLGDKLCLALRKKLAKSTLFGKLSRQMLGAFLLYRNWGDKKQHLYGDILLSEYGKHALKEYPALPASIRSLVAIFKKLFS